MNRNLSAEYHGLAKKTLVGGVSSPVRSFKRVAGNPIFIESGQGAYVKDVDGNSYLDLVMGYGPHLFGHRPAPIIERVKEVLNTGTAFGFTSKAEIVWAEKLLKFFPNSEKVRMMSTGTEACATAIRLARGITGRNLVLKCAGHYNGHVDSLMVDSGSGLATLNFGTASADSSGLPDDLVKLSLVVPFNDLDALKTIFVQNPKKIACFILEPVMGNMGVVPPNAEFLNLARKLCTESGTILIFDEVMTGCRVGRFSAQGRYGVEPDLTCLAKIIGGGFPLAAVCGKSKLMDFLAPEGKVYQAGTFSGNPVCVAGGTAMLDLIEKEDPYQRLEALGLWVEEMVKEKAAKYRVPLQVGRVGSMVSFYFQNDSVKNADDCKKTNSDHFKKFFWALADKGVLIPPSPFEACFLSVAHLGDTEKNTFSGGVEYAFSEIGRSL